MRKKFWIWMALMVVIPGLLFTVSCAKKTVKTDASAAAQPMQKDSSAAMSAEELAKQRAIEEAALAEKRRKEAAKMQFVNEDVYFAFDRSDLSAAAQDVLKRKAAWLRANPGMSVIIEGHCDERGTNEYNLALGDRRAESSKRYLMDLGISGAALTTISYGEEQPLDAGHSEEAWAKNRRAHFVLK